MTLLRPVAALFALALALPAAQAQGSAKPAANAPATKSLGTPKPGGPILTRDELRSCMALQAEVKRDGEAVQREREALESQKAKVMQQLDAVKAENAELNRRQAADVAAFKVRAEERERRIAEWNRRSAELDEMLKNPRRQYQAERERAALEREREAIAQADAAFREEAQRLNRTYEEAFAALKSKAAEADRSADEWNQRQRALAQRAEAVQVRGDEWRSDCAGRRFREEDEMAIQAGK